MPGIKISALPAAASAQLSDVFPADQLPGPVTRKISLTQVLALFQASIAPGAPNGSVQYNNGGVFGGDSGFISDGAGNEVITGSLQVDNLRLDGNTLSSINANGTLNIVPDGIGCINLLTGVNTTSIDNSVSSVVIAKQNNPVSQYLCSFINNAAPPNLIFVKSRSPTIGAFAAVTDTDDLGYITWNADDGSDYGTPGAQILVEVEGVVSNGAIPASMQFYTNNEAGTGLSAPVLTINSSQQVIATRQMYAQSFSPSITNIVSAGGNTVLTAASSQIQQVTGSLTQTITLPVVSTFKAGYSQSFMIINNSTLAVTVNSSGGNLIATMAANTTLWLSSILNTGTTAAVWNATYIYDGGSGIVSNGTVNQLAWYSATGNTVSGLATANNGLPVTSNTGVPSILAGPGTTGNLLRSNAAAAPSWSTSTYPATNAVNTLLYASSANVMGALATANNGILVTSSGGVPSIGNTIGAGITLPSVTFNSTSGVIGTTTNNNAAAGSVGEYVTSTILAASGVSLSSSASVDITSISLTAGDWDIIANASGEATVSLSTFQCWTSLSSVTLPDRALRSFVVGQTGNMYGLTCPPLRVSTAGTVTVYMSVFSAFSGTGLGYGTLSARRRR
ncbi:MAG TPA: hypothetical protein ACFYDZ_00310 [Candidatus Brocadiaceae bacterium]